MLRRGPLPIVAHLAKSNNENSLPEVMLTIGLTTIVYACGDVGIIGVRAITYEGRQL